jgi:protoporphyrin/coproporphyrin ferrochelatase
MKTAILLLNFGEPENATLDDVVDYLDRIFFANGSLEDDAPPGLRVRSRRLAESRAASLLEDYRRIGGSPLNRQAREQAQLLAETLALRGHRAAVFAGMQFTRPCIPTAVCAAREWGADRLIALPVYPLAGPSTTDAALAAVRVELDRQRWTVPLFEVSGWHRSPAYVALRAAAIRDAADQADVDLSDSGTHLVFSAHGTPLRYLAAGSRYHHFVAEHARDVAHAVGVAHFRLGYQNHANRATVRWTQPEVSAVIRDLDADAVIVDPISFMHEQSETLVELDHELRGLAESRGMRFVRVPIPYASPEFIAVLAGIVERLLPERAAAMVAAGGAASAWASA